MGSRAFKDRLYGELAAIGRALASPHRSELLDLLAQGNHHVEAGALADDHGLLRTVPLAAHGGHEQRSATALSVLERHGYANLHSIEGGWSAWLAAGYPVANGVGAP